MTSARVYPESTGSTQEQSATDPAKTPAGRVGEGARSAAETAPCEPHEISTRFTQQNQPESTSLPKSEAVSAAARGDVRKWELLGVLWKLSDLKRVAMCGRFPVSLSGMVGVRAKGDDGKDSPGYSGLGYCGSVWACPRCSSKIMAERRFELGTLITLATEAGYTIAFGTVTLRHSRGQSLEMLWDALSDGQRGVTNATKVKRLRKALNQHGYVRATEVTHGQNGWHPHIHTLRLFDRDVSQEELDELRDAEYSVWVKQCLKRGLGLPDKRRYELRKVVDADVKFGDYFAKGYDPSVPRAAKSVGFEMTGAATKSGRKQGSRTPWQILEACGKYGLARDTAIWLEYEAASKGRRALVWSNGLKDEFGIGDVSDDDIIDDEIGSKKDTLFYVTDWSPIARDSSLGGKLLGAVRRGGLSEALAFCQSHDIPTAMGEPVETDSLDDAA